MSRVYYTPTPCCYTYTFSEVVASTFFSAQRPLRMRIMPRATKIGITRGRLGSLSYHLLVTTLLYERSLSLFNFCCTSKVEGPALEAIVFRPHTCMRTHIIPTDIMLRHRAS